MGRATKASTALIGDSQQNKCYYYFKTLLVWTMSLDKINLLAWQKILFFDNASDLEKK